MIDKGWNQSGKETVSFLRRLSERAKQELCPDCQYGNFSASTCPARLVDLTVLPVLRCRKFSSNMVANNYILETAVWYGISEARLLFARYLYLEGKIRG